MKPTQSSLWLAVFGTLILTAVGTSQDPGAPKPLEHIVAERSITVLFDPVVSPISEAVLDEIVQSNDFAVAAIGELIGGESQLTRRRHRGAIRGSSITEIKGWADKSNTTYFITFWPRQPLVGGQVGDRLHLSLQVDIFGEADQEKAEKYADLAIKHLGTILADLSRRELEIRVQQHEKSAEEAIARFKLAQRRVDQTSAELRNLTTVLSESILQDLASNLKKQQQALEVELAGMKGRAEALQQEVAKVAERVKKEPATDDVLRNLDRVVELRKEQLAMLQQFAKQGVAGGKWNQVAQAQEQVALAEVELAQAKRAATRPAGEQLEKLNSELSNITVNRAEIEAKLQYVEEQLELHEELLKGEAVAKPLRQQLEKQISALATLRSPDQANAEVEALKASFRPARVEVFELKPSDDNPSNAKDVDSKAKKTGQR